MPYMTNHLDTLAKAASLALSLGMASTKEEALTMAIDNTYGNALDIVKGVRKGEWTTAQVDEYRDLLGVIWDVRNGFVSPTIGNVRQYVLDHI